ncbi:hypothetical protein BKA80DRAFT_268452 [Phyllosticta citrichinensis]
MPDLPRTPPSSLEDLPWPLDYNNQSDDRAYNKREESNIPRIVVIEAPDSGPDLTEHLQHDSSQYKKETTVHNVVRIVDGLLDGTRHALRLAYLDPAHRAAVHRLALRADLVDPVNEAAGAKRVPVPARVVQGPDVARVEADAAFAGARAQFAERCVGDELLSRGQPSDGSGRHGCACGCCPVGLVGLVS